VVLNGRNNVEKAEKDGILKEIRRFGCIQTVCDNLGINRMKFYRERDKDPIFAARIRQAKADYILRYE
jgi:hypothetical protein